MSNPKILFAVLFLVSFSAFADCADRDIANGSRRLTVRVCGEFGGTTLANPTIDGYKIEKNDQLANLACAAFGRSGVRKLGIEKVYRNGPELGYAKTAYGIGEDAGQPILRVSRVGCDDFGAGFGLPNALGACDAKIVRSIECR
jgi:hypothetical protein